MKSRLSKSLGAIMSIIASSSLSFLLNTAGVYAESSAVDNVNITIPVSCSMTGTVSTAHTATVELGTYEENIGETTFKVLCNDANGFAVYAIGYSNDEYGNTTMKPSTLPDSNGIVTGTATSGGTSNWAMKLTAVSGDYSPTLATGFNAYHAVPAEYTKVASLTSSTDATVGSSFKSTYAAFISQAQAADTYTGKVKYTVVHPSDAAAPDTLEQMQNLSPSSCTTTPTQVRDIRDGHAYTIQRLLDSNCWMMENLDLGRTALTTDLTFANTNIVTTITASTFNSWQKTSGTATLDAGEFISVSGTDPTNGTAYGTLYNYYVASAGTISGNNNNGDAQYDICPAGWRLPTGGDSGEFRVLANQYNNSNNTLRASIENSGAAFALAGTFNNAAVSSSGSIGYYWSSTLFAPTTMYSASVSFYGSSPSTSLPDNRGKGFSLRCVLKEE